MENKISDSQLVPYESLVWTLSRLSLRKKFSVKEELNHNHPLKLCGTQTERTAVRAELNLTWK